MNTKEEKDVKPITGGGPIGQSIASALPADSTLSNISIPKEAAIGVVKGSLGFSALSGVGGMIYGALRAQPAILYGLQYGLNTFSFAFPIFAVRQYIAIPWYNEILHQRFGPDHIPSLHFHNIVPTTVSGALMGGAMSTYFSGRRKLWAGVRTFGVLSLALQLASNELSVLRINLLAGQDGGGSIPFTQASATRAQAPASIGTAQTQTEKVSLRPEDEGVKEGPSLLGKAWDKVASWSPVHRISDEEYERSLMQRREEVAEQLRSVDQRIAEEEKATHKV